MKKILSWTFVILFVAIVAITLFKNKESFQSIENPPPNANLITHDSLEQTIVDEPEKLYGIIVDKLNIYESKIKKNQFLADILSDFNVPYQSIDIIARDFKDVFDVRRLVANKKYTILFAEDSLKRAEYFIYEPSPTEYVVFDFKDKPKVTLGQKQVDTVQTSVAGEIHYSLYQTMKDQNASPLLVNKIAKVFAWQIDFFRVQKGDQFKVIYEELRVEDEKVGIGKIIAAYFNHFDNPYYGFFYDQGSGIDYFDEEGNSLRKEFLKAPLDYSRISSHFSHSRLHPVLKIRRPHHGIDYAAPSGTEVHSVGDGIVIKKGYHGGAGNMVKVKHNSVYTTAYLHLSRFAKNLKVGQRVKQGETIGYVGSTGLSTGPHLDFRYWMNGSPINPLSVNPPPSEPIDEAHIDRYNQKMKDLKLQLDEIPMQNQAEDDILYANSK